MDNAAFSNFMTQLMLKEIAPAIPYKVDEATTTEFANKVLDRFRNPNIEHQWISISAQYSSKLKMRVLPLLLNHYKQTQAVPEHFAAGFAAFLRFMKSTLNADGKYVGQLNGEEYVITDSQADIFYKAWTNADAQQVVKNVLKDVNLWDTDLTQLAGFESAVTKYLQEIENNGALEVLENIDNKDFAR
jgi:tagaturonate reductase